MRAQRRTYHHQTIVESWEKASDSVRGRKGPITSEHEARKGRERGDELEESEQVALFCFRQKIEQFTDNRKLRSYKVKSWYVSGIVVVAGDWWPIISVEGSWT